MRPHLGLLLLFALALSVTTAGARHWVDSPVSVPGCEGRSHAELDCGLAACRGYGTAADWADEVQVRFQLPHPTRGGPWLVEYVAFFMSGTGTHSIVIRDAGSRSAPGGAAPGPILDSGFTFVPAAASWPPGDWTYVQLPVSVPYPSFVMGAEGEHLMFGTALLPGDTVGLSDAAGAGDGWGYYQGVWENDTPESGATPAVRIGLTDLGLSGADISTWSSVKALFRQ